MIESLSTYIVFPLYRNKAFQSSLIINVGTLNMDIHQPRTSPLDFEVMGFETWPNPSRD